MIDLAAVAAAYRERLRRENQFVAQPLVSLGRAVRQLDVASARLDTTTRSWPVLLHRDDALTVWVAVPPGAVAPGPSVGESVRANAERSVAGFTVVTSAWDQARALYEVTSTLREMAAAIEESVTWYRRPVPAMFDPVGISAGHLVGQSVLILRTALAERPRIAEAVVSVWLAVDVLRGGPAGASSPPPAAAGAAGTPLLEQIVGAVDSEVALLMVLPGLGALLAAAGAGIDHEVRTALLARFTAIEAGLYDLRVVVLQKLIPGNLVSEYLYAADYVLRYDILEVCIWLPEAAGLVLTWIQATLTVATELGRSFAWWFNAVNGALDKASVVIQPFLDTALPGPDLRAVVGTLPPAPRLDPAITSGSLEKQLLGQLDTVRDTARSSITTAVDAARGSLQDVGRAVERVGPTLARTAQSRTMAAHADRAVTTVFGDVLAELDRPPADQPFASMAQGMEQQVLSAGGFDLVAGLVPGFLTEAGRIWHELSDVSRSTSPHILARHGRLAGVRVPEVTVRVGREPDDALAGEVATHLRDAVVAAYGEGRRRFDALAAAGGRR